MKKILILISIALCGGCVSRPFSPDVTPVSPEQFAALYHDIPERYWFVNTRFRETRGYFLIDLYEFPACRHSGTGYIRSWGVRRDLMPEDFPVETRGRVQMEELSDSELAQIQQVVAEIADSGIDLGLRGGESPRKRHGR